MRNVYPQGQIAHLWAHRTQASARSAGNGNLFFNGDTIYSYGRHFPIARHAEHEGKDYILFTTGDYSATTRKHKRMVERAIPEGIPVFYVARPEHTMVASYEFDMLEKKFQKLAGELPSKRGLAEHHAIRAEGVRDTADALAKFFGLKCRISLPEDWAKQKGIASARTAKAEGQRSQRREENMLRRMEEQKDEIAKWITRERTQSIYGVPYAYLRLEGELVETSQGASAPLAHVKKAIAFWRVLREAGKAWETNGHTVHLGGFKLDRIAEDGMVVAGCHRFQASEVERFAKLIES